MPLGIFPSDLLYRGLFLSAEKFHAHLVVSIDTLQRFTEFFEGDRLVSITILKMTPVRTRSLHVHDLPVHQWCDQQWWLFDRREYFRRPSSSELRAAHFDRFSCHDFCRTSSKGQWSANLLHCLGCTYVKEKSKFALASVELRCGRFNFASTEFGEKKDELLEIDFIAFTVIIHDHVDQTFAERIDVHLNGHVRPTGEGVRLTSGMHKRSSRVKKPQSRLSKVLKRLYRRCTCLPVNPME